MIKSAAESYEIIRFMEHGNRWRPAMDCVRGELLIDRIRRRPEAEKEEVFGWIRQLAEQLERYHRCRSGQCYRYVNPYSVLIAQDGKILLLDLDAESNAFVLKSMQKRAMRNHFVKPLLHIRDNTRLFADFYGFGKTVQFMMASTITDPPLTYGENRKLYRITERCLSEDPKRVYQDFGQIRRDLPVVRDADGRRKMRMLAVSAGVVLLAVGSVMFQALAERENHAEDLPVPTEAVSAEAGDGQQEDMDLTEKGNEEGGKAENPAESIAGDAAQKSAELDRQVAAVLGEQLAFQTTEGNQEVIRAGESVRREVLRCLAEAYVREKRTEQAVAVYRELCLAETDTERLRGTYIKRMQLEQECGNSQAALETGREASVRFAESKEIQTAYLQAIYQCETVKQEERKQEAADLIQRYPFLRETEEYLRLEETFHLIEQEGENAGKESQDDSSEENAAQDDSAEENAAQGDPPEENVAQGDPPEKTEAQDDPAEKAEAQDNPAA